MKTRTITRLTGTPEISAVLRLAPMAITWRPNTVLLRRIWAAMPSAIVISAGYPISEKISRRGICERSCSPK